MSHFLIFILILGSPIWAQMGPNSNPCPKWSLTELVGISPLIIEAKLRSHSGNLNSTELEANFQVRKVHKNLSDFQWKFLRLTFSNQNELCPKKLIDLQVNGKFIIFAKHSRLFGFEPIVSPLKKTRRAHRELYAALCLHQSQYCHRGVSLTATVQKKLKPVNLGHHVRLNCQYNPTFDKWRPHTKWKKNVKWFKNGRRLRPKALPKNISIKNKRRKSMLIISNVSHKDLASYQCKTQSGARSKFQVIQQVPPVVKTTEKSPTVPVKNPILEGQNCPLEGYCLNGGTCRYFQAIGELSCLCASDYYGQRCEFKGVNTHNIVLRSHSSSKCVLGITHYPC